VSGQKDYKEQNIPFSQASGELVVRVHHKRFLMRGRVEDAEYNWAELTVEFVPARNLAEWVFLTEYLESFAERALTLEQACVEIHKHLLETIKPAALAVKLRTEGHGGFEYEVEIR
jgi:hypothetical protein